jgi:hypothetical protein
LSGIPSGIPSPLVVAGAAAVPSANTSVTPNSSSSSSSSAQATAANSPNAGSLAVVEEANDTSERRHRLVRSLVEEEAGLLDFAAGRALGFLVDVAI